MKKLVQATAAIGTTEAILVGVTLLRNKFLAITIGPEGFGIYGLLNAFFLLMAVFSSTWLATGTTKYIAEYNASGDRKGLNQVFTLSLTACAALSMMMVVILLVLRPWFQHIFLAPEVEPLFYILFVVTFTGMGMRPLLLAMMQGLKLIRQVVLLRWIIAISEFVLVVICTWLFGLTGFFISLCVSHYLACVLMLRSVCAKAGLRLQRLDWSDHGIRLFLIFGAVNLFLSFVNLGSQYLQKAIVNRSLDIASVGYFQAGLAVMAYMGMVRRGAQFQYLPDMSEKMEKPCRVRMINEYLFFILWLSLIMMSLTILFGSWAIQLLYSNDFMPLTAVLFWFVLGQFFNNFGSAFQTTVVGMARLRMHALSTTVIVSLWVLIPYLLISRYGVGSVGMGFVIGSASGVLLNGGYLMRAIRYRLSRRVIIMILLCGLGMGGAILIRESAFLLKVAWTVLILMMSILTIRREEWRRIWRHFNRRIRSFAAGGRKD